MFELVFADYVVLGCIAAIAIAAFLVLTRN
jgi:hypothetical protein